MMADGYKYKVVYNKQAYKLALLGATDAELADFFEVCKDTIQAWKHDYPKFKEALIKGKMPADADVAVSLHKRAVGYDYTEITYEKVDNKDLIEESDGQIMQEVYKKKVTTKHMPPDTNAARYFLNNRRPKEWRDKTHSENENTNKNFAIEMTPEQIKEHSKKLHEEY
jgi:hypothetical protein